MRRGIACGVRRVDCANDGIDAIAWRENVGVAEAVRSVDVTMR